MTTIETLAAKVVADYSGFDMGPLKKELKEAERLMNSMRSPVERLEEKERRLQDLLAAGAVKDIPAYNRAMDSLRMKKDQLTASTERNNAAMNNLAALPGIGSIVTGFTSVSGAVALATKAFDTGLDAIKAFVNFAVDAGKRIDDLADSAQRMNVSVGALSELRLAAQFADVKDFSSVETAIDKMLQNVGDAFEDSGSAAAKALQKLGLDVRQIRELAPDEMFRRIAAEIAEIPNNAARAAIIADIFGKGGKELKTLIADFEQFSEQARKSGAVVTDEMAAEIEKADDAFKRLNTSIEAIGNSMAVIFAPAVASAADALQGMLSNLSAVGLQIKSIDTGSLMAIFAPLKAAGIPVDPGSVRFGLDIIADGLQATQANIEQNKRAAELEAKLRESNERLKAGAVESPDAAAKETDASQKLADEQAKTAERLREQIEMEILSLTQGKDAVDAYKLAKQNLSDQDREEIEAMQAKLNMMKQLKQQEEEEIKFKNKIAGDAERIKQSLQTPVESAIDRLRKAQSVMFFGEGELTDADFDKLLAKEAKGLFGSTATSQNVSAKTFGSQEAIAATLGANADDDSARLEAIKQALLDMLKRPPVSVGEVPTI